MANLIQLLTKSLACAPQKSLGPIYTVPSDIVSVFFSHLDLIGQRSFGTSCKGLHTGYLAASPTALAFSQLHPILEAPVEKLVNIASREIEGMRKKGPVNTEKLKDATEQASRLLFACFVQQLHQMNIKPFSPQFHTCGVVPQCMISVFAKKKLMEVKFAVQIRRSFNLKFYNSVIDIYASFPIEKITIENFKEYVGKTHEFFDRVPVPDIEAALRNHIKALNKPHQIDRLREEFTHLSERDPRFIEAKAALELDLNSKKIDLHTQLNRINGQICALKRKNNAFDAEKKHARVELAQAYSKLITVFQTLATEEVNLKDRAYNIQRIRSFLYETNFIETVTTAIKVNYEGYTQGLEKLEGAYNDYLKKKRMYERLPSPPTRKQLMKISNAIAQYTPGTTILDGGKLFEIEKQLEPDALTAAAWEKMAIIAKFYKELNIPVDCERLQSVAIRHHALRQIID